jgi:hypothetical protein
MPVIISQAEYQKLNQLKELDLQVCSFCQRVNILNLGWEPFVKLLCQACQEEHVLCLELCLPVAKNIFDCHLYQEVPPTRPPVRPVQPNKPYDWANCYLCSKELAGASKKGVIKNRNNPSFWGLNTEYKILCLGCVGARYLGELSKSKRRTFQKYLRRGYV